MLSYVRAWRERGWIVIDAATYADVWHRFGGSVSTHPQVVERLAGLAGIAVRYLGWFSGNELQAAIPTWGRYLALSKEVLKQQGKKGLFDLGNAEVIFPVAPGAQIFLHHRARYISPLHLGHVTTLRPQTEGLAMAREPEAYSKKFRYNQRREQRLLEEAGGVIRPMLSMSADEQALVYAELFQQRWGFEATGKANLPEVFGLMRDFMTGSLIYLNGRPIAIQVLYRVEAPQWVSLEYINGGVDPQSRDFSPGSVLSFINIQAAWADARSRGKSLRYSFGRADREYKNRWCDQLEVCQV
jgi:hypothetical protein